MNQSKDRPYSECELIGTHLMNGNICDRCGWKKPEPNPHDNKARDELEHAVSLAIFDEDSEEVNIRRTAAIMKRIDAYAESRVVETAKAYGGCHKCYGKGYATVKSQITGYGTDGDIGGYEGKFKQDLPIRMNFCDCERGKQLQGLTDNQARLKSDKDKQ